VKRPVPNKSESGFALLIVFLLAAAIALMLYQQMPRVAFESERDKEQLLIDRGEQYKRAIYLFMQVNKRYPARMEDLENTNDKRFLRRRYIDPFTGKNEWRLIHTNGVALTDSLVQKPPANPGDPSSTSASNTGTNTPGSNTSGTSSTNTTGTGTDPTAAPAVNAAVLQRPSDRTLPTGVPGQFTGQPFPGQPTGDPNQVGIGPGNVAFPPITLSQLQGTQQGVNGQTGGQPGQQPGIGQPNGPGTPQQGFPGGIPPVQFPIPTGNGQPGATDPSQAQPPNTGQFQGQFQPNQFQPGGLPGLPGGVVPPGGAAGGANTAASLINQLLTTPRTPPPGIGPATNNNNAVGGGIAGVASTFEGPSIKSYNTRTKFNEWEFVFQNQQQTVPGQATPPANGQLPTGQPPSTGTAPPAGTGPATSQ
jgi:hypothetical protein